MRYINASAVLPEELVEKLQEFVQGEYLYIPAIKNQHRSWGELSGARQEINKRNHEILKAYILGASVEELSESFHLSTYAIRKIIYQK
ncbi:hypothetical protein BK138_10990 [Paenibacillus rhizosphaerae]|uniref:Mor transcription activator domain-containing protein n=1 Tax=Paenibacillus rhizosphaerae TaxID=297318 RepID=A0A1R1F4H3_9BACL|nr:MULTISPECIES: CD3324 family protein [Paenibacillus]OMF58967.1 hypothetical protein BK138_10990 [Paenibacillus rhizosphaerae]UYO04093.1 hypothetical protein K2F33_31450 [Paenibacillus sp. PSB04]